MIRRFLAAMAILMAGVFVTAAPASAQYQGVCGFVLDPPVIALGGEVHIIGGGFEPNSTVTFEINGVFLGSTVIPNDADGPLDATFQVPADLPDGEYVITTSCAGSSVSQSVIVGDPTLLCGFDIFFTGQSAQLRLPGFEPNSLITVTLYSDPVQLYSGPVTGNPMILDVTMPAGIDAGDHIIEAVGTGIDGQPKVLRCGVRAEAGDTLPITGSDATTLLVRVGLALVTLGGLLFVASRKRNAA